MTSVSADRRQGINSGAAIKVAVQVATTGNITLSGLQTIDGVVVASGDRVLVRSQTAPAENGIYNADSGNWSRAIDFDGAYDVVEGTLVEVIHGASLSSTIWKVTTVNPSVGSAIAFAQSPLSPTASSAISFIQAGVGAITQVLQDFLRRMIYPTPYDFGAVGDGVTDDDAAIQAWITAIGTGYYAGALVGPGVGYLPTGKFKFHTPIVQPDYSTIFGNDNKSVLLPTSALNGLVAYSAGRAAINKDFVINGTATTGTIGFEWIGGGTPATLAAFCKSSGLQSVNFTGTTAGVYGTGFRLAYCDESSFTELIANNCHYGFHTEQGDDTGGYPADIDFNNCRAIECTSEGFRIDTGFQIRINGGTARMCENSGVLIGQTGLVRTAVTVLGAVEINKIWTEQNWQSLGGAANGNFDIRVENGSRFSIRDHYCPASGGTYPLPLYIAACADFVIDNPNIANLAGGITIAASATNKGYITNLPPSLIGNIPTLISVGAGAIVSLPLLNSVGQYTATRATGVGTGTVGYTGGQAATVTLAATKAFTFTCDPGKAFIVTKGTGEACMVFGSYANATLTLLANPDGVGHFALTAAPGAGVIGISKAAASDVITIANGAAGGTYGISVSVVGGNVSAVTDPA